MSGDARPAHRRVMSAYSGEHGVYGIVLTTALLVVGWDADANLQLILFVAGTVFVFWLAHLYAAVIASRATDAGRREPVRTAISRAARHSGGMLVATLVPVVLLAAATVGLLDESLAYALALASGVVVLALIGWFNASRNGGSWLQHLLGATVTASLGLLMIALSVLIH